MIQQLQQLYDDTKGLPLDKMINISIDENQYTDTAYLAQIRAVLAILAPAKWASVILAVTGIILAIGLTLVSVTHVWEVLGAIKPNGIEELNIPADMIHSSALAFTIAFDLAFVYLTFISILSSFAGTHKPNTSLLILLLGVLNALFIVKYFPGLDITVQSILVGGLTYVSVILIPVVFIVTLLKLKAAIEYAISGFIAISIKQETYSGVLKDASVSLGTPLGTSLELERAILALAETGLTMSAIAKKLGGNYQKRLEQVRNALEKSTKAPELPAA